MIISEKQIIQLLYIANEFRHQLLSFKVQGTISETGQQSLDDVSALIFHINNNQSEELKVAG
jgi:hypothetical protein